LANPSYVARNEQMTLRLNEEIEEVQIKKERRIVPFAPRFSKHEKV
jgi:hypothetical protein